jgi:hypothetical protein
MTWLQELGLAAGAWVFVATVAALLVGRWLGVSSKVPEVPDRPKIAS